MGDDALEVTLRDGGRAVIRPIRPSDKERLAEGLRQLSPSSRYLRFHAAVSELTDAQLAYLTEVDQRDHVAWVALDPDSPDEAGMAVARYVRLADDPTAAEAAITVADDHQGRGLATILLRVLAQSARANGISRFRSYVLEENVAVRRLFERLGASVVESEDAAEVGSGVLRVDLPLPVQEDDELDEEVLRRVLRSAASRQLPPLRLVPPLLWWGPRDRDAQGTRTLKRRPNGPPGG